MYSITIIACPGAKAAASCALPAVSRGVGKQAP